MTRWKVSITWHEGFEASGWCVEAFEDQRRVQCVTGETDPVDDLQAGLAALARAFAECRFPRLF